MKKTSLFILLIVNIISPHLLHAGNNDTISLDVKLAEQRFVDKNLNLLAANYDIKIAETNILQARLWYNPSITYSQTLYNGASHQLFDISTAPNGEYSVQLQQLFSIAGKHTNLVKLTRIQASASKLVFNEVLRSLKLEMYNDIIRMYADQEKLELYNSEVKSLENVMRATREQVRLGAIAANELVRLTAEYQGITNNGISIQADLFDAMADLKILLHYPATTYIKVINAVPATNNALPDLATALNASYSNRSDLKLAENNIAAQSQNLKYQKSLATPDLTLGGVYDKAAAAGFNYSGIYLASDLAIFNRNQGGIKAARLSIEQAKINDSLQTNQVQNQVAGAYLKLSRVKQQVENLDPNYVTDLEDLMSNAINNYNKRYISLLEFLDQLRTYTNARFSLIELNTDYMNAIQNFNYNVGTSLIK